MSASRPDSERVWLQAMISALGGVASTDVEHEAPVDWRKVNRGLAADAAEIADAAILEWRKRYPND